VDKASHGFPVNAPDLAEFQGPDAGTGGSFIEKGDFANGFTCYDDTQNQVIVQAYASNFELSGNDEEELPLIFALFDHVMIGLDAEKFAITREQITVIVVQVGNPANGRERGAIKG